MIAQEEWMRWVPMSDLAQKYTTDTLSYLEPQVVINLLEQSEIAKKIGVKFLFNILEIRKCDGNLRLKKLEFLEKKYGASFYECWTFFIVENSELLHWIVEQAGGSCDIHDFTHYALITSDSILDIVSYGDTKIDFFLR